MRRGISQGLFTLQRRTITGVAPTLYIPKVNPDRPIEQQVERNTASALELLRLAKGPKPAPYTRKYKQTFEELSQEVEALLGSAEKMRRPIKDNEPLDKLGAMERALRHALVAWMKDDGRYDFAAMEKWLVYTGLDSQKVSQLRQVVEKKEKYAAFRKKRAEAGATAAQITAPSIQLQREYDNVVDREVLVEKRVRYDTLARNTTARNDAAIDSENAAYVKPIQDRRLDQIVELLEKFKPMLAREAILQRLTIKHLEGQLGIWRYLDWNPELRDRAELEADNYANQWWNPNEEKRLGQIRLRSKNELSEVVEKNQARRLADKPQRAVSSGGDNAVTAAREKLLAEIIRMQQRVGRKEDADDAAVKSSGDSDAKAAAAAAARAAEEAANRVPEAVVAEKGLIGLDFVGTGSAKASA